MRFAPTIVLAGIISSALVCAGNSDYSSTGVSGPNSYEKSSNDNSNYGYGSNSDAKSGDKSSDKSSYDMKSGDDSNGKGSDSKSNENNSGYNSNGKGSDSGSNKYGSDYDGSKSNKNATESCSKTKAAQGYESKTYASEMSYGSKTHEVYSQKTYASKTKEDNSAKQYASKTQEGSNEKTTTVAIVHSTTTAASVYGYEQGYTKSIVHTQTQKGVETPVISIIFSTETFGAATTVATFTTPAIITTTPLAPASFSTVISQNTSTPIFQQSNATSTPLAFTGGAARQALEPILFAVGSLSLMVLLL